MFARYEVYRAVETAVHGSQLVSTMSARSTQFDCSSIVDEKTVKKATYEGEMYVEWERLVNGMVEEVTN